MVAIFLTHPEAARRLYYGPKALAGLQALGTLWTNSGEQPLAPDALVHAARDATVIVSDRQTPGPAELFDRLPDLVAFVRVAVDIRNVDVEAASRNGIMVTRASPGFGPAVAEWIVGAMVALGRHVVDYAAAYRMGSVPASHTGREIRGSTVGVIGFGTIGRRLCALLQPFEARVLVHDPFATPNDPGVTAVDLTTLLAESDFVVPLAVATPETENLIGADALARMKRSAYLVNASRGNLVDEAALAAALDGKHIAGAAMDVGRAADQMPTPSLAARDDVIATPHIGGLTPEAIAHQAMETVRQVESILRGVAPVGAVNADRATRLGRLASRRL